MVPAPMPSRENRRGSARRPAQRGAVWVAADGGRVAAGRCCRKCPAAAHRALGQAMKAACKLTHPRPILLSRRSCLCPAGCGAAGRAWAARPRRRCMQAGRRQAGFRAGGGARRDRHRRPGGPPSHSQVANRRRLMEQGLIDSWPRAGAALAKAHILVLRRDRHALHCGGGGWGSRGGGGRGRGGGCAAGSGVQSQHPGSCLASPNTTQPQPPPPSPVAVAILGRAAVGSPGCRQVGNAPRTLQCCRKDLGC